MSADLEKVRARLRALKSKTVENGCTQEEAMGAAEKAAELLSRHGISEQDLLEEEYSELGMDVGRRSPLETVWGAIGHFADCKAFWDQRGGKLRFVYFGRESDVLVAEYIHGVMHRACLQAIKEFKETRLYKTRRKPRTRAQAVRAFQETLAAALVLKLREGLWKRYRNAHGDGFRNALTLTRQSLDGKAADRFKLKSTRQLQKSDSQVGHAARVLGYLHGQAINVEAGIGAGNKVSGVLGAAE